MRAAPLAIIACLAACASTPATPPTPLAAAASIDVGHGRSVAIGALAPRPADSIRPGSIFLKVGHEGWSPDVAFYSIDGDHRGPVLLMAQLGGGAEVRAYKATFASDASLEDAIEWFGSKAGAPDSVGGRYAMWQRKGWTLLVTSTPADADFAGTHAWLYARDVPYPAGAAPMAGTDLTPWERCAVIGFNDCRL